MRPSCSFASKLKNLPHCVEASLSVKWRIYCEFVFPNEGIGRRIRITLLHRVILRLFRSKDQNYSIFGGNCFILILHNFYSILRDNVREITPTYHNLTFFFLPQTISTNITQQLWCLKQRLLDSRFILRDDSYTWLYNARYLSYTLCFCKLGR